MPLTLDKVEKLAPDQASLDAARKLLKPATWPALVCDGAGLVWGECQGSGSTPYRVVITEGDAGYKCTCPSRKFPCKHSLALMWMRAEGKAKFADGTAPEWVKDWVSRRRGSGVDAGDADARPRASIQAASVAVPEAAEDPKAEARAAAARERNRQEREASILAGLDELDVWLSDQVERGLAGFAAHAGQSCRLIAQRLVDAKAGGIAARVEGLPTRLFTLPEAARSAAALQELGVLHLLAEAYRRQELLPAGLKADVRQAAGWSMTREALLADASAARAMATWRVVGAVNEVQADKLRRMETWLLNEDPECANRFAVLIDFVPVATGAATSGYSVGDRLEAELVFYPSARPVRAQIARSLSGAQVSPESLTLGENTLAAAYAGYLDAMAEQPWLGVWPLSFRGARVRRHGASLFVCDGDGLALALQPAQAAMARPLLSLEKMDGIGLWDGYYFNLCWAQTELGGWVSG